jgi:hypothetical protein
MALNVQVLVETTLTKLKAAGFLPPESALRPAFPNGGTAFPPTFTYEDLQRLWLTTILGSLIEHVQLFGEVVGEVTTVVNTVDATATPATGTGAGAIVPQTGKVL